LELGSGTGLLGMVASKLGGPQCVILTDGDDKAVALLEENLANPANDMNQTVSKTKALLWGETQQMEDFSQWCRSKWPDTFESDVKFEYIIAGDVMYKAELPPLFFGTCDKFLETNGTLWLCHIPRANVGHELVVSQAEKAGFSCEPFDASQIKIEDIPIDDLQRARVYCIRRRSDTSTK
jgi:predicted nicotinamide N-methyase